MHFNSVSIIKHQPQLLKAHNGGTVEIKQQDLLEHINSLNWCLQTTTFPCSCFHAPVATIKWQMLEYCRSVYGNVLGFFKRWLIQYIQSATSFVITDTWHPFCLLYRDTYPLLSSHLIVSVLTPTYIRFFKLSTYFCFTCNSWNFSKWKYCKLCFY